MAILIEKGEVFSPAPVGKADLLIIGDSIQKVGKIDREALARLDLETEFVDASDGLVVPGLIDPHEHLLGKAAAAEAFVEDSNRSIQLVGKEAQD